MRRAAGFGLPSFFLRCGGDPILGSVPVKNLNDILSGVVILCLCAGGWYGVSTSTHDSGELVGSAALPTLALAGMALCALILIVRGLVSGKPGKDWGERKAVRNVLLFFGFFVSYLAGMTFLGDYLAMQEWFPWPHNGGFTIMTFLFLLLALPLLGRRNRIEIASVALLTTGILLYAFGHFFQIMLP